MKFIKVEGKKFIVKRIKHRGGNDTLEIVPYDKGEYEKKVGEIASKLQHVVDLKAYLMQRLSHYEWEEIERIHKALLKGKKVKSKNGCYLVSVGNHDIVLVD